MEKEINDKMKLEMENAIKSELDSIKIFEGKLPKEEYDRLYMMIPVVVKGSFLLGFKAGCEMLGVDLTK